MKPMLAALAVTLLGGLLAACERPPVLLGVRQVPAEERTIPWKGIVPACDDPAVIGRIAKHFREREERFWYTGLEIETIDYIKPVAYRPWGVDLIPRRFCIGRAHLNDRTERRINYSVIEDGGIIGATFGVDFCILGLDRHNAYAPYCKMALP